MIQKDHPQAMTGAARPAPMKAPTSVPSEGVVRERVVKRHIAVCPYGANCSTTFNDRTPKMRHVTADGAEVEAVRHMRDAHAADFTAAVSVKRQARVRREIINEEVIG